MDNVDTHRNGHIALPFLMLLLRLYSYLNNTYFRIKTFSSNITTFESHCDCDCDCAVYKSSFLLSRTNKAVRLFSSL